jgi:Ca2+/H+ antiporter, TMEM165/GDT1 family
MDWKLFGSTFALIFLAELGDKTQFAAFAATAGAKSPWSIFVGASTALVLSTLLAVLLGDTIQRWVPQQYLKMGAGALFVLFGVLLLIAGLRPKASEAVSTATVPARSGVLARLVLAMAEDFERASAHDYASLAANTDDPQVASLLRSLADEEAGHLGTVRDALSVHGDEQWTFANSGGPAEVADPGGGSRDGTMADTLERAIAHERATAAFYRQLATVAHIPSLRATFAALSAQEHDHARRLAGISGRV